jgi:hypothetical protein
MSISWEKVQQPICYGGLGIHNLEVLGWSLHIRWLWEQKIDEESIWAGLPVQVPCSAQTLFKLLCKPWWAMVLQSSSGQTVGSMARQ